MSRVQLKTILFQIVPVLLLSAVLFIIDIALNKPLTETASSDMLPTLPVDTEVTSSDTEAADMLALYSHFNSPVEAKNVAEQETVNKMSGLSLAEQDSQQGLLRSLYINDKVYRLSAVIKQQRYIANLTVTDITNPDALPQRLSLQAEDKLHHYEVLAVSATRITLRHQQRELWLQLFMAEQALPFSETP